MSIVWRDRVNCRQQAWKSVEILSILWSRYLSFFFVAEPSRPPPAGCCPSKYIRQCCPITGDNETVYTCPSKSFSRSGSSTRSDRAIVSKRSTYKFDYRTDCVHRWRTQACVGGVYLNVTNGKPEACPAGSYKFIVDIMDNQIENFYCKNLYRQRVRNIEFEGKSLQV